MLPKEVIVEHRLTIDLRLLFLSLLVILTVLFLISGCGKKEETLTFTAPAGEKMEAFLDGSDGFHMENYSGTLLVYQKKKVMLKVAFLTKEQEQAQRASIITLPFEIRKSEDNYISYGMAGPEGMVNYYMYPAFEGSDTWLFIATHLPKETAEKVQSRLHFRKIS